MKKILVFALILVVSGAVAQCPMCKMAAESNMKNGGSAGLGLNGGIIYLFMLPYLIVGGIAYWWWKNRKAEPENALFDDENGARLN
jgi:hypothetical protein